MYIVLLKFKIGFRTKKCLTFFPHPRWKIIENEECYFSIRNYWKIDPNNFSMIGNSTWIIFRLKKNHFSMTPKRSKKKKKNKTCCKTIFPLFSIHSQSNSNNSSIETHFSTREKAVFLKKKNCNLKQFLNWTSKNLPIKFYTTKYNFNPLLNDANFVPLSCTKYIYIYI